MSGEQLLIVDDDDGIRFGVAEYFRAKGYAVDEAPGCARGEDAFRRSMPDVVILDHALSDGDGLQLLRRLRAVDPNVPAIILTGHGTIDLAVAAIKEGAHQFLTKPVELSALHVIVERVCEQAKAQRRGLAGKRREERGQPDLFRGTSRPIRELEEQAHRVLASDSPILICGETGAGKGVLAAWLHENGPRASAAFVDLNCAALARDLLESELFGHERGAFTSAFGTKQGLLELAHRGTIFLDEVGDLDLAIQPRLLKVLEEKRFRRVGDVHDRRVDVRLVTATHRDLDGYVADGRFRADLYFRIATLPLTVPALRDRREDIPLLAQDFARKFALDLGRREIELTPDAIATLQEYAWPGNIRELRSAIERAILMSDGPAISARQLGFLGRLADRAPPQSARPARGAPLTLADVERLHVEHVLRETGGRVEEAARLLGIPRSSLYNKIKKLGLASRS
jgi:DNA-binding NtrC family response regulator